MTCGGAVRPLGPAQDGPAALTLKSMDAVIVTGGGSVTKQIGQRYQESSVIALEERVRVLPS